MVWFTFTFLLGIPNGSGASAGEDKSKKPNEKLQVKKPYREIEVSKPIFSCHIEYVLFPNEAPKFVDVVCWDEIAKIYCDRVTSAIRPFVVDKLKWIHFRVNHKLTLTTDDLPALFDHTIRVSVSLGNKKFGDYAKSDNPKKFFVGPPDPGPVPGVPEYRQRLFQPVTETLAKMRDVVEPTRPASSRTQLRVPLDTAIETYDLYDVLVRTMTDLSNEYHDPKVQRSPFCPSSEPLPAVRNLVRDTGDAAFALTTPEKRVAPGGETRKKDPAPGTTTTTPDSFEYLIPGESLFSGRKTFEYCLKYLSDELPFAFNLLRVRGVMTRRQVERLNPLSVTLSHCNDVPVDDLSKHGVTSLRFEYVISNEYLIESPWIPLASNVKMDYTRTLLTSGMDKNELVYFLQTGGLRVNVYGNLVRDDRVRPKRSVYDEREVRAKRRVYRRSRVSKVTGTESNEYVLLGTAFADISAVLNQPHRVLLKCNFRAPDDGGGGRGPGGDPQCGKENFSDLITLYEFYSYRRHTKDIALPRFSKMAASVLTVSVRLSSPLSGVYRSVTTNANLLNRLFAIINDPTLLHPIIRIIETESRHLIEPIDFCRNGINVKRPLTIHHAGNVVQSDDGTDPEGMTGFLIDCISRCLVFVEGSLFGAIQQIWSILSRMHPRQGTVLYDSSLVFTERLYRNFFKYGGFLKVNLQRDLSERWAKPEWARDYCMTELTWKALISLNMLMNCKSIRKATQNNLFPDSDSLKCLALELGVPVQMHKKINSKFKQT